MTMVTFWRLILFTGLREPEATGLTWDCVVLQERHCHGL